MTKIFRESKNDIPLFADTDIQSKCVPQNDILELKYKQFCKLYTSKNSTITMISLPSQPMEYIRIEYKLQITRSVILHGYS